MRTKFYSLAVQKKDIFYGECFNRDYFKAPLDYVIDNIRINEYETLVE